MKKKNKIDLDEIKKAERDPVTVEELEDAMRTVLKHPPSKNKMGNREPTVEEMNEVWKFPRRR